MTGERLPLTLTRTQRTFMRRVAAISRWGVGESCPVDPGARKPQASVEGSAG
jgi:hypothetical protein